MTAENWNDRRERLLTETADRVQEGDYGFDTLASHAGKEIDLYDLDNALNGA